MARELPALSRVAVRNHDATNKNRHWDSILERLYGTLADCF